MLDFNLVSFDLRKWDEFSERSDTDKSIRLLHKGQNGLIVFVTENDDFYLANKHGHERLEHMSGRKICQLGSTRDFTVAGTVGDGLMLIASSKLKWQLTCDHRLIFARVPHPHYLSLFVMPGKFSAVDLMDCGDESIFISNRNSGYIAIEMKKVRRQCSDSEYTTDIRVNDIEYEDKNSVQNLSKLSCGTNHAAAIDFEGVTYMIKLGYGGVYRRAFIMKIASVLRAKNVACLKQNSAFLLTTGDILLFGSTKRLFATATMLVRPPNSSFVDITCNKDVFVASTASSIIRFNSNGLPEVIVECETNLFKAFEGLMTTPSCSLASNSNQRPLEKLKNPADVPNSNGYDLFYNSGYLSDITLTLKDSEMCAHKLILSSRSLFFSKLFLRDFLANSSTCTVDVSSYDPDAYRYYIRFIYLGHTKWEDLSYESLIGAYRIAIENAENFSSEIGAALMDLINSTNVCEIFKIAVDENLEAVEDQCLQVANSHKVDVLISDKYSALTCELKQRLVQNVLK